MIILSIALLLQDAQEQIKQGPGLGCGRAFAIWLKEGESLTWRDNGMDFIVYRFAHDGDATTIYEGNFPQAGGVVRGTGLTWPRKVVIHDSTEVAQRVDTSKSARGRCASKDEK